MNDYDGYLPDTGPDTDEVSESFWGYLGIFMSYCEGGDLATQAGAITKQVSVRSQNMFLFWFYS